MRRLNAVEYDVVSSDDGANWPPSRRNTQSDRPRPVTIAEPIARDMERHLEQRRPQSTSEALAILQKDFPDASMAARLLAYEAYALTLR